MKRILKFTTIGLLSFSLWGCVVYTPTPHQEAYYLPGAQLHSYYPCPYHRYYDSHCRYCSHR